MRISSWSSDVCSSDLGAAIDDGARQRDFAAFDRDVDLGGIEPDVFGKTVVHILADAFVRPNIVFGAATAMILLAAVPFVAVAEPRHDLVSGAPEKAAISLLNNRHALPWPDIGRTRLQRSTCHDVELSEVAEPA